MTKILLRTLVPTNYQYCTDHLVRMSGVEAYLRSKLRERWRAEQPKNTWAARRKGEIARKELAAWDDFSTQTAGEAAARLQKDHGKDKTFWIDPQVLNAAGLPVGRRYVLDSNGEPTRSSHGARRDRKRDAKRAQKQSSKQKRGEVDASASIAGASANDDVPGSNTCEGANKTCVTSPSSPPRAQDLPAKSATTVPASSFHANLTIDPFHGRLCPNPAGENIMQGMDVSHGGSRRRKRRKRLEQMREPSKCTKSESAAPPATITSACDTAGRICHPAAASTSTILCNNTTPTIASFGANSSNIAATAPAVAPCRSTTAANPSAMIEDASATGIGTGPGPGREQRRPRRCFPYGNYDAYYNYRYVGVDGEQGTSPLDPRLLALEEAWFRGKDVLDIGCNAGQFTANIASRFGVRSMLGVDIDASLVMRAQRLLKQSKPIVATREAFVQEPERAPSSAVAAATTAYATMSAGPDGPVGVVEATSMPSVSSGNLTNEDFRKLLHLPPNRAPEMTHASTVLSDSVQERRYPLSFGVTYGGRQVSAGQLASAPTGGACFPENTRFLHSNFVETPASPGQLGEPAVHDEETSSSSTVECFDVVCCFSTSKWIHLNFGDDGIRTLFKRAHTCLRPGGRFILEPQPWSSYRKRAGLTPLIKRNFERIKLRPDTFADVLTSPDVGFASARTHDVPYGDDAGKNFRRRPLIVCVK